MIFNLPPARRPPKTCRERLPESEARCVMRLPWSTFALLIVAGPALAGGGDGGIEFFEKKIRPVLVEQCYRCHSEQANKRKAGLTLDTRAGVRKGGGNGPIVVPGKPAESVLIKALRQTGELKMPEDGKLSDAVIADFEAWIKMGVPDPREGVAIVKAAEIDWAKARAFWAFVPPVKHAVPRVADSGWARNDIDGFVHAEREKRGLKPVRPAGKRELLRRATFDLIGLPPTPAEMDAFVKDDAPEAFAKVVERLLSSPHYGERWGRYWLDVARYADDQALALATASPHAYRYRDWVVQAFNADMPYDRFVRLQLAGDLMPAAGNDFAERLAGLGFQGLGAKYHKGSVAAQVIADELDDRIDTLSRGLLGLTVACARCHDHKYDPIPTRDYYGLAAAYNGASWSDVVLAGPEVSARFNAWQKETKQKQAELQKGGLERGRAVTRLAAADAVRFLPTAWLLSEIGRKQFRERKAELDRHLKAAPPAPPIAHGVSGGGKAMPIYIRGSVDRPGELAPAGFVRILQRGNDSKPKQQFTRLDLADAIATAQNPLTARVIVNRVWQHHFGRGIVGTPSNFGKLGDPPTHPELLDTLAVRFVESGWSLRWLHREIMLSATYRLSGANDPANAAKDPDSQFLWRVTPHRLDVEAWRDAVLAVSGRLDPKLGGPSLDLSEPTNVRRTVYAKVSRFVPNTMLALFDFPDANVSSDRRGATTVPQQQLFVLNSAFMIDSAKAFAKRLARAAPTDVERIGLAFQLAYGRQPTVAERALGLEFLAAATARPQDSLSAWEQYAQIVLATNEFAWID
jgi:hypothetical protein